LNHTPDQSRHTARNAKKPTIVYKAKARKNITNSQSGEETSEGGDGEDAEEPPDSSDGQDDDEQPAVVAPSCDKSMKSSRKAGRHQNNIQAKGSAVAKLPKAKTKLQASSRAVRRTDQADQNERQPIMTDFKNQRGNAVGTSMQLEGNVSIDSDDDDYGAVDDISESDEGDDELERLEEQMIIVSYIGLDAEDDYPIPSSASLSRWNSFGVGDQLFLADESFFEGFSDGPVDDDDTIMPSNVESEQPETPRRVHFADEVGDTSTDSNSSDTESNQFSDTFLLQDRLAPSLLHRIEHDSSDEDQSLSENEWDVRQDGGLLEYEHFGLDNDDDSITSGGSSYESISLLPTSTPFHVWLTFLEQLMKARLPMKTFRPRQLSHTLVQSFKRTQATPQVEVDLLSATGNFLAAIR